MRALGVFVGAWAIACSVGAATVSGTVSRETGEPIAYAFLSLLGEDYAFLGYAITDAKGAFSIESEAEGARLAVQPPGKTGSHGYDTYDVSPRIYLLEGATTIDVTLPDAGCLILEGYDADGKLLRWEDYEARGMFGGQFVYWTDKDDRVQEAVVWPVHDGASKAKDSPRGMGVPAIFAKPGTVGVPQMLYWETAGYGKLLLRAHNDDKGYVIPAPGKAEVVHLNEAFAQSAVHDLERRFGASHGDRVKPLVDALSATGAEDEVLVDALRTRDDLEHEVALAAIAEQRDAEFTVGVFQGGAYDSKVFKAARDAGFDLATILPGWAWCDLSKGRTPAQVNQFLGVPGLKDMGYAVKVHGAVWLQGLGVLPEYSKTMAPRQLADANLAQLAGLTEAFGEQVMLWEAFNEPANVNTVGMPRPMMFDLLKRSAAQLKAAGKTTLINSGHEADYGNKYIAYTPEGKPAGAFRRTWLDFLVEAKGKGALDDVDVIGLQFYPGAQLNAQLGGVQGPCMTPGWLVDTLDRYAKLGKPIHITECSLPSTYESHWKSGFWREPWTAELQADYAARVLAITMAHPAVESFTWWDITDAGSSVIGGGLMTEAGAAKPVLKSIADIIAASRE